MNNNNYQFINRIPSSAPEIKEAILYLHSEKNIDEGKFETILNKAALNQRKPIISLIINVPIFQLSVNLNPQDSPPRVIVLMGTPVENRPRDNKTFIIGDGVIDDLITEHKITVFWKDWKIIGLEIDDVSSNEF